MNKNEVPTDSLVFKKDNQTLNVCIKVKLVNKLCNQNKL